MARSRTGEQRPNRMNSLAVATNDAADIALSKLQLEDGCSAARNFREHHVVGKFDQLPNNKLEKFSHDDVESIPDRKSTRLNSSHSQISYAVFCLKNKK